jgi:tRNA-(ms[2]io[6]A)-hydroxylase
MLCLQSHTQDAWLQRAIAHTDDVLIDHAHCERKAASNALNLLGRFPDHPELQEPMLALAREELEHFELVLSILKERQVAMVMQAPSGYQARLFELVRSGMPHKLVDLLLVGALIEARSCERFRLLSDHHPDAGLRQTFRSLLESEARHYLVFVKLAEQQQARDAVRERLQELAAAECGILEGVKPLPRIHS